MKKSIMMADLAKMASPMPAKARRTLFQSVELRACEPMSMDKDSQSDMDLLMALLSLQRVDSGFDLDSAMLGRLGIKPADIAAAVKALPGDRKAALRALHTAIVLAVLETRFADARDTWFAAVRKSRTWLKQAAGGWGPVVAGKTVEQWAKETAAVASVTAKA
jgi:hypothetical protein